MYISHDFSLNNYYLAISHSFFQKQRSAKGKDSEEGEENIVGNVLQLAILSYY